MAQDDTSNEMEDFEEEDFGEGFIERMRVKERLEWEIRQEERTSCVFPECRRPLIQGTDGCRIHVMAPTKRPRSLCRAGRCIEKPLPGDLFCSDHEGLQEVVDDAFADQIENGLRWVWTTPWGLAMYKQVFDERGAHEGPGGFVAGESCFDVVPATDPTDGVSTS